MSAVGVAYGKLILLGEHAVVYGAPALVAGLERGLRARADGCEGDSRLSMLGRAVGADAGGDELQRAFAALLAARRPISHVAVEVSGDLPAGVGLGHSAAAGVAIARAVDAHSDAARDRGGDEESVRDRAMAWEQVFHGNPSGVDVAAAMRGGCLRFTRAHGTEGVTVGAPLVLCVGLTGIRSATKGMVAGVARLRERNRDLVDRSVDALATCVDNAIGALGAGDASALGELMNLAQMLLSGLMVSGDEIESMCALAREAGAVGAKLTGAGGGGAVVALAGSGAAASSVGERVLAAWRARGYEGFSAELRATS